MIRYDHVLGMDTVLNYAQLCQAEMGSWQQQQPTVGNNNNRHKLDAVGLQIESYLPTYVCMQGSDLCGDLTETSAIFC